MAPKILVVDPNKAFATMLQEMLKANGGYQTQVAHSGSDALALLDKTGFDLTIVDMDLASEDMGYHELIQKVRQNQPTMRLMLIPLMGEDPPPEAHQLNIQGALSKPFFVDDLLPNIEDALTKKVGPPTQPSSTDTSMAHPVGKPLPDIQAALSELVHEANADIVLLASTSPGAERVLAHVSTLNSTRIGTLASLSIATIQAARATARFLGQPDEPFEHNMFEGKSSRLYIMTLPENLLLVIVAPVSTPLGTIRHNLRRTSRRLTTLALT